jgi:cytosine/adenosine deaminase-related metal-dependent hydrolase
MPSSLIRGKYVVCGVVDRHEATVIEDGAVFQRDGVIVDIGAYDGIAEKYEPDEVIGSPDDVVIPGLVNSHHHVGLTPIQLGSRDHALELWLATRIAGRAVDPYLDTLYSAFEMIGSGVTTVQHLQVWAPRPLEHIEFVIGRVLDAYDDIGMRVSFSYALRDQNRMVYEDDADFLRRLPADLAAGLGAYLEKNTLPLDEQLGLFEDTYAKYNGRDRARVQLGPCNLHWCSDRALAAVREMSDKYRAPMHMHLVESAYQKEYARRRGGGTAVEYIHRHGMLGPLMTLGHSTWFTEGDIEIAADTGTHVCHNASSNLRLRSGIAPVNRLEARGVNIALGIDEAGINDDRDMLQEMRMVLKLHREPGFDDSVPTSPQVLRMATENGARTTPFGAGIGTLEIGKAADLVVMSWRDIAYPFLDLDIEVSVVDAIIHRAKSSGVRTVLVAGEPVLRDGRFTRVDKEAALDELAASLARPANDDELRRMALSRDVLPHVRKFYDGYLDAETRDAFYAFNSRR